MALDLRRNFVSSQYLENYLTYLHQILYMQLYRLAWIVTCYFSEICTRVLALYAKILFRSIS